MNSTPKLRRRHRRAMVRTPFAAPLPGSRRRGVSARTFAELRNIDGVAYVDMDHGRPVQTYAGRQLAEKLTAVPGKGWAVAEYVSADKIRAVSALRRLVRP